MSELRKTVLASIVISLLVGFVAGGTAGILGSQLIYSGLGQTLTNVLPPPLRPRIEEAKEVVPPAPISTTLTTTEVVRRVSPAVVSILISKEVTARSSSIFPEDLFREFGFEIEVPREPSAPSQKKQIGGGTGFIVTADGLIVTNKHVVFDEAASYTVVTSDGKRYEAKILAKDPFIDLAVIKIEANNLPIVRLGNSDTLEIGETVIAIGNALAEFSNTITTGVVSGIKRRVTAGGPGIGAEVLEEAIQTDAAINPGNSGGPLVNLAGEVVGINTAVSAAGQNVGFAIPINAAKASIESVKTVGRIVRPWIGVRYIIITPELKAENQLPVDYGALIVRGERQTDLAVIPGSPADKAGLRENNIILEVNGSKVTEDSPLGKFIQQHKPGDSITFKVLSQGKETEVKVMLEELKQ